jgi:hypothetical protein
MKVAIGAHGSNAAARDSWGLKTGRATRNQGLKPALRSGLNYIRAWAQYGVDSKEFSVPAVRVIY